MTAKEKINQSVSKIIGEAEIEVDEEMIKKYTNKYNDTIKMIEIIRESKASVFFKGGSNARKETGGGSFMGTIYTDTPKEVYNFIKAHYKDKIARVQSKLTNQIEALDSFEQYWKDYKNES